MSYMVIHINDDHEEGFPLESLHILIGQVDREKDPEKCVSLTHETEWCLSLHAGGYFLWENNLGDLQDTWYMSSVPHDKAIKLWGLLANGEIETIQKESWIKGDPIYGI